MKLLFLALAFHFTANLMEPKQDSAPDPSKLPLEVRRGFNAAAYATRDLEHPETWSGNLEHALAIAKEHNTNSARFYLGIEFGFSYRVGEFLRNNSTEKDFKALVIQGTLARLKYEEAKGRLGITDADIIHILQIPISSFSAWKVSAQTSDTDRSVVDRTKWLLL